MKNHIFPFLWMRGESEETIRREMNAINHCGIGAVCLEARPHPDFCGERWWHDVDIVLDEAKKRNMKVWILDDAHFPTGFANGMIEKKYPERKKIYINYNSSDVISRQDEISLNVMQMMQPKISFLDIGKPIDLEEVKRNTLIALVAARMGEGNTLTDDVIDLTEQVCDGWLEYRLPEGIWRIFAVFTTRLGGGRENYINMLDEESVSTLLEAVYEPHYQRYKKEFGTIIAGFFSDEPEMGNVGGYGNDERIGHKEMPLPWCNAMPDEMERRFGANWKLVLPLLWNDSSNKNAEADTRLGYMDIITRRYERCFGQQVGTWCETHGVEHIGHVVEDNDQHTKLGAGNGHYFRSISGQHMAGVDVIRNQILPGAGKTSRQLIGVSDSRFYHYVLAKLGSSAAAIDPKKKGRTMCELYGAYDWNLGVRDMSWILNHLLVRGVNELVPHAFSMKEYPDIDCPPHFYAEGNNPQFEDFAELMHYANRMCEMIQNGRHMADAGLLYQCEGEWTGESMPLAEPAEKLTENQIDFDILPTDVFTDTEKYQTQKCDGYLSVNGNSYRTIFIPYMECMPVKLAEAIASYERVNFVLVGDYPKLVIGAQGDGLQDKLKERCTCVALEEIGDYCAAHGLSSVKLHSTAKELAYYHYKKDDERYLFFNESLNTTYSTEISIEGKGEILLYDGWTDTCEKVEYTSKNGKNTFHLELEPYELKMILVGIGCEESKNIAWKKKAENDISHGWKVSLTRAVDYPNFKPFMEMNVLEPVSKRLRDFSGIIRYEKDMTLLERADKVELNLESAYECVRVYVDGKQAGFKLAPPYKIVLKYPLDAGNHRLQIDVTTSLAREQMQYPAPPFCLVFSALEPTGMFGKVKWITYEKDGTRQTKEKLFVAACADD